MKSRKIKKSGSVSPNSLPGDKNKELEKENIYSRLRKRDNRQFQDTIPELKSILSPEYDKSNCRPLTFWEKKLKNLESQNKIPKEKKHELYEFTDTDESEPSYISKKKYKQKSKPCQKKPTQFKSKKKVPEVKTSKKPEPNKPLKETKNLVLAENEEENLVSKNNKFIFSSENSQHGITSTPAYCKSNIIEASSFMFLSPVTRIENPFFPCENVNNNSFKTSQNVQYSPQKTKRVLRTRKIAL